MEEKEFWDDYEIIRNEVDRAIEAFYTYMSIHRIANDNREIYLAMNQNPTFWNINLYSLQTTFFITMGRIFDDGKDAHSVHKLLSSALAHPDFFSKKALAKRKTKGNEKPIWLDEYLKDVFEPGIPDLRQIKIQLKPYRRKFDEAYRDIRNTVFAHTITKDSEAVSKLFGNTKIPEIEDILYVLKDLLESLWELYHNGRRLEFGKASKNYASRIEQTTHDVLLNLTGGKKARPPRSRGGEDHAARDAGVRCIIK